MKPTRENAKSLAPGYALSSEIERYKIQQADYRNIFGELLWTDKPYQLEKLFAVGDPLIENYVNYTVKRVAVADGIIHYNIIAI